MKLISPSKPFSDPGEAISDDVQAQSHSLSSGGGKCKKAGFVFDPAIKRIEPKDYWISQALIISIALTTNPEA